MGRLLAERGLPVLDADVLARQALAPGSKATAAVLDRYGKAVRCPSAGAGIDRAALGRIVFADGKERQWLEQLVHPIVRAGLEAALAELASAPAVVLMVPLLKAPAWANFFSRRRDAREKPLVGPAE